MHLATLLTPFFLFLSGTPSAVATKCKSQIDSNFNDRGSPWKNNKRPALDSIPSLCKEFVEHGQWHKGDKESLCTPYFDKDLDMWRVWVFTIEAAHHRLPHEKKLKGTDCRRYLNDPVIKCNGYGGAVHAKKFDFIAEPGHYAVDNKTFIGDWVNAGLDTCIGVENGHLHKSGVPLKETVPGKDD